MRGVACKLTRELGLFKLISIHADPIIKDGDKAALVRKIENGITPLFGTTPGKKVEEPAPETAEDYYLRVLKAHREQESG